MSYVTVINAVPRDLCLFRLERAGGADSVRPIEIPDTISVGGRELSLSHIICHERMGDQLGHYICLVRANAELMWLCNDTKISVMALDDALQTYAHSATGRWKAFVVAYCLTNVLQDRFRDTEYILDSTEGLTLEMMPLEAPEPPSPISPSLPPPSADTLKLMAKRKRQIRQEQDELRRQEDEARRKRERLAEARRKREAKERRRREREAEKEATRLAKLRAAREKKRRQEEAAQRLAAGQSSVSAPSRKPKRFVTADQWPVLVDTGRGGGVITEVNVESAGGGLLSLTRARVTLKVELPLANQRYRFSLIFEARDLQYVTVDCGGRKTLDSKPYRLVYEGIGNFMIPCVMTCLHGTLDFDFAVYPQDRCVGIVYKWT